MRATNRREISVCLAAFGIIKGLTTYTQHGGTYSGAAMKSNASGSSTYRSLAQKRARVATRLGVESLQRLADICEAVKGIAADLSFDPDGRTRIKVSGRVHCDAQLACHRCEELVWCHVSSDFASVIAFDEEQAASWSRLDPNLDILIVGGANLDVASW